MTRPVKFRGLRVDGKGWVYGDLITGVYPVFPKMTPPLILDAEGAWEVIPETVGQFTGLIDKNGKEIYEGDKITGKLYDNFLVMWDNSHCGWNITSYIHKGVEVIGNIHEESEVTNG